MDFIRHWSAKRNTKSRDSKTDLGKYYMKIIRLVDIHDKLMSLLDQENRENRANNGEVLSIEEDRLLNACADYLNELMP